MLIITIITIIFCIWCAYKSIRNESNAKKNTKPQIQNNVRSKQNEQLDQIIQNDMRIMNDCLKLINESKSIVTVINRYNDLLVVLKRLSAYESNPKVIFKGEFPSDKLNRISKEKYVIMNIAVQRAYDYIMQKPLDSKVGINRRNKILFFSTLRKYKDQFPHETQVYIQNLISDDASKMKSEDKIPSKPYPNTNRPKTNVSSKVPSIEKQRENESLHDYHKRKLSLFDPRALTENDYDIELSNKEILFLRYMNQQSDNISDLPLYWTADYNLDYKKTFDNFFSGGYMRFGDLEVALSGSTIKKLKNILKENNLSTAGDKTILINRAFFEIDEKILLKEYPDNYFVVTRKGKNILEKADFLHYFHSNSTWDISMEEAQSIKDRYPDWDKYQVALHLLGRQLSTHEKNKDWGLYRNTLYGMSEVYRHCGEPLNQLECLCYVCYLDLSGLVNGGGIVPKYLLALAPFVVGRMAEAATERMGMPFEQCKEYYLDFVSRMELPHTHYTPEKTWDRVLTYYKENF